MIRVLLNEPTGAAKKRGEATFAYPLELRRRLAANIPSVFAGLQHNDTLVGINGADVRDRCVRACVACVAGISDADILTS